MSEKYKRNVFDIAGHKISRTHVFDMAKARHAVWLWKWQISRSYFPMQYFNVEWGSKLDVLVRKTKMSLKIVHVVTFTVPTE